MSRTDKTRKFEAQVLDCPRARHDHSTGPCDLLPIDVWAKSNWRSRRGHRCDWEPRNWHTYKGFARTAGESEWIGNAKNRKNKDWKDNYDY